MRKRNLLTLLPLTLMLVACGDSSVKNIKPLTLEEVSGNRMANLSQNEKDGVMYKYLTNSIIVDSENLITIDTEDFKTIQGLLDGVHKTLKGVDVKGVDGKPYITDDLANYLLFEFTKTPYEWKHVSTTPKGFDASTRMYFIDVNYETTDKLKYVIPTTTIEDGLIGGEVVKEQRYIDYMTYLSYAIKGDTASATPAFEKFKQKWGSIDTILEEQDTRTLLERVQSKPTTGLGGVTYTGVVQDPQMTQPAKATVRYILNYRYNLGEETTLQVSKAYLKGYELQDTKHLIESENLLDKEGQDNLSVLEPYIKQTLHSYEKAVTEKNHRGLHSLHENYAMFDKYFTAMNRYTYTWVDNFNFKIIDKKGTDLKVLVDKQRQYRGKHTDMSMPTYKETHLYTMVMSDDDKLKVKNSYLLKSDIIGEPNTVIKNISGVSDNITYNGESFSKENKAKVEDTVKKFLQAVYENDTMGENFTDTVDLGVSENTLLRIHDNVKAITGADTKVNYITWDEKSNVYTSLKVREIFLKPDHNVDTESKIELVNRNGKWYVINYVRTLSVKTKAGEVTNTKNILSENTPSGSQDREEVKDGAEEEDNTPVDVPNTDLETTQPEDNSVEEPVTGTSETGDTPIEEPNTETSTTETPETPTSTPEVPEMNTDPIVDTDSGTQEGEGTLDTGDSGYTFD